MIDPRSAPSAATIEISIEARVERALAEAAGPITVAALRQSCRVRTATICEVLAALVAQGRVTKSDAGYLTASS